MKFALVYPGQGSQSLGMMAGYGDSPVRFANHVAERMLARQPKAIRRPAPARSPTAPPSH